MLRAIVDADDLTALANRDKGYSYSHKLTLVGICRGCEQNPRDVM